MRRREFIALIGGAVAWSPAASAQQSAMALVGLLSGTQLDDRFMAAVRQGLKDAGYTEGRNVAIKHRSADGRFDRLPTLAAELGPTPWPLSLRSPRRGLHWPPKLQPPLSRLFSQLAPIPSNSVSLPVSIAGGNVTGVTFFINALGAKRLELLRELVPSATVIGFLITARNPTTHSQPTPLHAP